MYWHLQCTSPEAVEYTQNNCILTASNLNNPSQRVRERIGDYSRARSHGAEFIWDAEKDMSPEMYASHSAATRRMHAHGAAATSWLSYDFLSAAESQALCGQAGRAAAASQRPTSDDAADPTQLPPPPIEVLEDTMLVGDHESGDAMSTLSHHTTALSLLPFN